MLSDADVGLLTHVGSGPTIVDAAEMFEEACKLADRGLLVHMAVKGKNDCLFKISVAGRAALAEALR